MKKLVKVVAVLLVLATLSMSASTVMAAPVNGASHASDRSSFARMFGYLSAVWHSAVWGGGAAVWGGNSAVWGAAVWSDR